MTEDVRKALALIDALTGPHDVPSGDDHEWRECRRCLAQDEVDRKGAVACLKALATEVRRREGMTCDSRKQFSKIGTPDNPDWDSCKRFYLNCKALNRTCGAWQPRAAQTGQGE
jgi:hypothetical protein